VLFTTSTLAAVSESNFARLKSALSLPVSRLATLPLLLLLLVLLLSMS
jgi:hypothetical protein